MISEIEIVRVEKDGSDGLVVTFSDRTVAGYVVEELLQLRPCREALTRPAAANPPTLTICPAES